MQLKINIVSKHLLENMTIYNNKKEADQSHQDHLQVK